MQEGSVFPLHRPATTITGFLSPAFLHLLQQCRVRKIKIKQKKKKNPLVFNYVPFIEGHVAFIYQPLVFTFCPKVTSTSEGIHSPAGLDDGLEQPEMHS